VAVVIQQRISQAADEVLSELPLPRQLLSWAERCPDVVALRQKDFGIWQPITWAQYAAASRSFGYGLVSLGLGAGDKVAVLSENRKEWVFAQFGVALFRGITCGVYPTSPAPEIEYLLTLSDAPFIICEDQEQFDKVLSVRERLPKLRHIIVIDPRGLRHYDRESFIAFETVSELGKRLEQEKPQLLAESLAQQGSDDVGLIVFTSGSTGRPKAAMMTWRGLGAAARGLNSILQCGPDDSLVSYLPLCHVAEQMFSVHVPLATGAVVNFAESLRTVQEDLRELAPSVFFGVPRIWEKFYSSIQIKLREAGGLRLWLYKRALAAVMPLTDVPRWRWSLWQRTRWWCWYFIMLRSLLNFVGLRRCRIACSSGAPIAPDMLRFFRAIGLPIREAYGLTEASGATTMQANDAGIIGAVGVPYPGIEVALAEDGEILIRGEVVFRGYYRNDDATREAIDAAGWLHTGDVARWDGNGAARELRIVDRKKDIMITAGGKNITPSEIENALRFSPYIKEAIIIADRRRFVSALIQIDFEGVAKWAEEARLSFTNFKSLAEHPQVSALIQREVDAVNVTMPQVQRVRKFSLLAKELDHDDGEVTATMKVRRKSISEKYADLIEQIYA
jgi:long-chain acyl-CoA synthetase